MDYAGSFCGEKIQSPPGCIDPPPQPEINPTVKSNNAIAVAWVTSLVIVVSFVILAECQG